MKTITIKEFYGGFAADRLQAGQGEYAYSRFFDTLSYPHRLQPVRGMETHTSSTGIANLIVSSSNGLMYGVGQPSADSRLYKLAGYGASDAFAALATDQVLFGTTLFPDFLVEYPDAGNTRTIFWAGTNTLVASDPAGGSSATTQSLTFSSIGQGLVHPKDKILYFPYRTSSASYLASIGSNATPFTTYNSTAFTLPSKYRVYCLTPYGNYLAIPATSLGTTSGVDASILYLWGRDTSISTVDESVPWGDGVLKVLNNLNGVLIGISELGSDSLQAGTSQDYNAILIKAYAGGSEPVVIKEIKAQHLAGSSTPSVTLNHRVNFIHNNRLYFSANVVPNDGTSPSWYGLWSVGKNPYTGAYSVVLERMGTNAGTDTGILAAAAVGDYFEMVHTSAGTLTRTINGITSSSTYGATSVWESAVNQGMPQSDIFSKKKLRSITVHYLPLPTNAAVSLKQRTDSTGSTSDWVTVGTSLSTETTAMERTKGSVEFTDGRNFEFRVESTGGAVITGITYRYDLLETNQ